MKFRESHMIGLVATSKFAEFCMNQEPCVIWRENSGRDYGFDGEIEFTYQVNDDYVPTGNIQKVLIKSIKESKNGSIHLSMDQMNYFSDSNVPILLVAYIREEDQFYSLYISNIPPLALKRGKNVKLIRVPLNLFNPLNFEDSNPRTKDRSKNTNFPIKDSVQLKLIDKLENCPPGVDHWRDYEEICSSIVSYLFQSSFRNYQTIIQPRNENGLDIKDLIIPNRSISPFWQEVRVDYNARNLVFEFKNHSKEIGKDQLVQTSNYLKKRTYGRFGIIFCRKGLSKNGVEEQKELLRDDDKLILVLNDEDLIEILKQRQLGKKAEGLLEQLKTELELKI